VPIVAKHKMKPETNTLAGIELIARAGGGSVARAIRLPSG
jgi:hypothetical protein